MRYFLYKFGSNLASSSVSLPLIFKCTSSSYMACMNAPGISTTAVSHFSCATIVSHMHYWFSPNCGCLFDPLACSPLLGVSLCTTSTFNGSILFLFKKHEIFQCCQYLQFGEFIGMFLIQYLSRVHLFEFLKDCICSSFSHFFSPLDIWSCWRSIECLPFSTIWNM